jgi:hypothetical protein
MTEPPPPVSPLTLWEQCPEPIANFETQATSTSASGGATAEPSDAEAASAPFTVLNAADLLAKILPEKVSVLGDGIIVMGQLTSLLGQGGTGKSRFTMQLAIYQILGRNFAGFKTHQTPLKHLLIGTENSVHRQQAELRKMTTGLSPEELELLGQHLFFHVVESMDDAFINIGSEEIVRKWQLTLEQIQPDVIYIDPFGEVVVGDMNKDADVRHTLRELTKICRRHNHDSAIIVVHHARTGRGNIAQAVGYDKGNYGIGSKALYSGVRSQINLAPADPEDTSRLVLSCGKSNDTKPFITRGLRLSDATMTYEVDATFDVKAWLDDVEGKQSGKAAAIADTVRAVEAGNTRYGDIARVVADETGCALVTAKRRIKEAVEGGYLNKDNRCEYTVASSDKATTQAHLKIDEPF